MKKKCKASNKGKKQITCDTTSDNIPKLVLLAIAINKKEELEEVYNCLSSTSDNIKFLSQYFDSIYLWHLTSEKNVFISQITKFSAKIECTNRDYFLV